MKTTAGYVKIIRNDLVVPSRRWALADVSPTGPSECRYFHTKKAALAFAKDNGLEVHFRMEVVGRPAFENNGLNW